MNNTEDLLIRCNHAEFMKLYPLTWRTMTVLQPHPVGCNTVMGLQVRDDLRIETATFYSTMMLGTKYLQIACTSAAVTLSLYCLMMPEVG